MEQFDLYIIVLYCSGDVHAGNTTRNYNEYGTTNPAVQVGALNTIAVLDWLSAQNLGELDELIVGGTSAGSVGAQVWSDYIIDHIPASKVAMLFDSFAGVFPPGAVVTMHEYIHFFKIFLWYLTLYTIIL